MCCVLVLPFCHIHIMKYVIICAFVTQLLNKVIFVYPSWIASFNADPWQVIQSSFSHSVYRLVIELVFLYWNTTNRFSMRLIRLWCKLSCLMMYPSLWKISSQLQLLSIYLDLIFAFAYLFLLLITIVLPIRVFTFYIHRIVCL